MKIYPAYSQYRPFRTTLKVVEAAPIEPKALESEVLPSLQPMPKIFQQGKAIYIGPLSKYLIKQGAAEPSPIPSAKESTPPVSPPEPAKVVTFDHLAKNLLAGTSGAASVMYLSTIPNTTTASELSTFLVNYNVAQDSADTMAKGFLELVKSKPGFTLCLMAAGGVLTLGVLEAVKPSWTWRKKLTITAVVVGLVGIAVLLLLYFGYMVQPGSSQPKDGAPSQPTAAATGDSGNK